MRKKLILALILSLTGLVYYGTLMYTKIVMGVCAFGVVCPYLFGIPVCAYGFVGFVAITVLVILAMNMSHREKTFLNILYWLSFVFTLLALYSLVRQLFDVPPEVDLQWSSGYPSCLLGVIVLGLLFFVIRTMVGSKKTEV